MKWSDKGPRTDRNRKYYLSHREQVLLQKKNRREALKREKEGTKSHS